MTGQQIHDLMEGWAGALGVRCSACHEEEQDNLTSPEPSRLRFAGDAKPMKEIARRMYTMTDAINSNFIAKVGNSGLPVTCGTCHQGRISPGSDASLAIAEASVEQPLKASPSEPCFQCHDDERAAFSMSSRHKVNEGLIACTDCHQPHGSPAEKHPSTPAQENLICTKCHKEAAGPFVYEHAVVKTEGCVACHVPHGGPDPHMLNRAKVDTICLLCHLPARNSPTGAPVSQAHDPGTQLRSCTACHDDVHGSNWNAFLLTVK